MCPANAISHAVAQRPPSLRSWYASSRPAPRSCVIASTSACSSCGSSRSGPSSPNWPVTCARIEPPMRFRPRPRSTSTSVVSPGCSCGVSMPAHVVDVANAVTIEAHRRRHLLGLRRSPCQRVRIDRLSLPTGTPMPSAGQSSMPTAVHGVVERASSPGLAARSHPVAAQLDALELDRRGEQVGDRLADRHAARGRRVERRRAACARPSPWPRRRSRRSRPA